MAEDCIPVRLSHLLQHCSVGAIVRGAESLMVVPDIRQWDGPNSDPLSREIRYVDQVRSALGITEALCRPPIAQERDGRMLGWIPALRFPLWMRCPKCGLMHRAPWRDRHGEGAQHRDASVPSRFSLRYESDRQGEDIQHRDAAKASAAVVALPFRDGKGENFQHPDPGPNAAAETKWDGKCACGGKLEQAPWVLVHEDGYMADVPWHGLAHAGARDPEGRQCGADWMESYLKLVERAGGRQVECTRCGASGSLPSRWPFPLGARQQPWIREPATELSKPHTESPETPAESPQSAAWLMEINDVRVHSPVSRTALVIPPESRIRRGTVLDRMYSSSRNQRRIRDARTPLARRSAIKHIANDYGCTSDDIKEAMAEIDAGYPLYGRETTVDDLLRSEYQALTEEIPDLKEDEDFVTEHYSPSWKALGGALQAGIARRAANAVDRLIAVNKLKEILVLRGFRRAGGERLTPPDIAGESDWLPAIELYGEGIFFTIEETLLQRWERNDALRERADAFAERYRHRAVQPDGEVEVSPRFLLCHTLAHILIRRLEAEAGYPAASLQERIYCARGREPMAGILIYVAVADEEGSLGGLMELARPERFLRLLTGAFEAAAWCSLDPVCADQQGHGPDLLNRAACHACTLLPETSCQHGNVLLDRAFIKGGAAGFPAFLDCVQAPG